MRRRGFTLLEVMVALVLLAFLMTAVTSANITAQTLGARVYNVTTATQLVDGVVLDIEEEYRLEPWPENSLEERECDLPPGFEGFECEYDLIGMEVGADNIGSMGEEAMNSINSSPLMASLCGGGPSGIGPSDDPAAALQGLDMQTAALGALAALVDPNFMQMCGVNLGKMCQNVMAIGSFIPSIIEQAAQATRKLRVRLTWSEGGEADRTLEVETFLTSTPEAESEEEGAAP